MESNRKALAGARAALTPFSLTRPLANESPVIVEVPHAGLYVPPGPLGAHVTSSEEERLRDADIFVDELFRDAPSIGASLLVAHWSRHVIDLNRSLTDVDAATVETSQRAPYLKYGLIWRTTGRGRSLLLRPLTAYELAAIVDEVHAPYHRALAAEIERKLRLFGRAILLAAHSMPSTDARGNRRADIVPGTCGRTTAAADVVNAVDHFASSLGFIVRHDEPYRGGYTTQTYGKPGLRVDAIQIEISRSLYVIEDDQRPHAQFERIRQFANGLMRQLGSLEHGRCIQT